MRLLVRAGIAILASYGAGFVGSLFVSDGVRGWYATLDKPWFNPPDWIFAPVWFVLYALMAAALVIVWNKDPHAEEMRGWVPLFFAHLLLNAAWVVFFFGLHGLLVALIDILLLAFSVFLLMMGAWEIDRRATYLFIPYFAWISFATILNLAIWYLN
jgi:tryptophan-rich sensory protein